MTSQSSPNRTSTTQRRVRQLRRAGDSGSLYRQALSGNQAAAKTVLRRRGKARKG